MSSPSRQAGRLGCLFESNQQVRPPGLQLMKLLITCLPAAWLLQYSQIFSWSINQSPVCRQLSLIPPASTQPDLYYWWDHHMEEMSSLHGIDIDQLVSIVTLTSHPASSNTCYNCVWDHVYSLYLNISVRSDRGVISPDWSDSSPHSLTELLLTSQKHKLKAPLQSEAAQLRLATFLLLWMRNVLWWRWPF